MIQKLANYIIRPIRNTYTEEDLDNATKQVVLLGVNLFRDDFNVFEVM